MKNNSELVHQRVAQIAESNEILKTIELLKAAAQMPDFSSQQGYIDINISQHDGGQTISYRLNLKTDLKHFVTFLEVLEREHASVMTKAAEDLSSKTRWSLPPQSR